METIKLVYMLKIILSGFIEDILRLIRAGFFETPSPKKIQLYNELLGTSYPSTLKDYLINTTLEAVHEDLEKTLPYLRSVSPFNPSLAISRTLRDFFTLDLALILDQQNETTTATHLPKDITTDPRALYQALVGVCAQHSPIDLHTRITRLNNIFKNGAIIRVQLPADAATSDRQFLRQELFKQYPTYFTQFSIEPKLVGGLRIFKDGKMIDLSWRSKIKQFTLSRST